MTFPRCASSYNVHMENKLKKALWRIYRRNPMPTPWASGGNLPWNDPTFSERMLREHLDESHGAASRQTAERLATIDWLEKQLELEEGESLFDVTCGPGLYGVEFAKRGYSVTGVDFSPASIAYARDLAKVEGVTAQCKFIEQDVRQTAMPKAKFDAAILLYGQLAVFTREEARNLVRMIGDALRPGGKLCIELLNPDKVDKKNSTWWYTDDTGLWGDTPYLHLGERLWYEDEQLSLERFQILHLETGRLDEVLLCDQVYQVKEVKELLISAGFTTVEHYPSWDNMPLYDTDEWHIYLATK